MAETDFVTHLSEPLYEPPLLETRKPFGPSRKGGFLISGHKPRLDLPPVFSVAVGEDAMAPSVRRADIVFFSTTEEPKDGQTVLIGNVWGGPFIRSFKQEAGGQWRGVASNPEFEDICAEGAWIIGVQIAPSNLAAQGASGVALHKAPLPIRSDSEVEHA